MAAARTDDLKYQHVNEIRPEPPSCRISDLQKLLHNRYSLLTHYFGKQFVTQQEIINADAMVLHKNPGEESGG